MSSAGQAVGGVVGAVAGFFIGGPSGALYGAQLGMMAGGLIDPPKGPEIVGPRLDDLKVQTSTYGAPIPRLYGTIATAGNIFWLENNALKEVAKKKKSGGKGGPSTTTTTFSYYATFALGLCDCSNGSPIAGVRRIWCGGALIYDAGSSDFGTVIASNQSTYLFTLHNGATNQDPDVRMQATLGIENTPAYRGLAYIVFNDFPLADYGNTLAAAQIKVEIVKEGGLFAEQIYSSKHNRPTMRESSMDNIGSENPIAFCPNSGTSIKAWSMATNPPMQIGDYEIPWPAGLLLGSGKSDVPSFIALKEYSVPGGFLGLLVNNAVVYIPLSIPVAIGYGQVRYSLKSNTLAVSSSFANNVYLFEIRSTTSFSLATLSTTGVCPDVLILDGSVYVIHSDLNKVIKYSMAFEYLSETPILSFVSGVSINSCRLFEVPVYGFGVYISDKFYVLYGGAWILLHASCTFGVTTLGSNFKNLYLGENTSYTYSGAPSATPAVYSVFHNKIVANSTSLADTITEECLLSNLLSISDIDTGSLTQDVKGYRVSTAAAIRGSIETLQSAWPFDVVQSGYKIVFKPRGGASVGTIPASDLDARGAGESPGVSITNAREMDSVLPRRVVANYLDVTREYDTGTHADERLNTDSVNIRTIEMAIVLNATEALGIVQTLLYLYWLERYDLSFSLPSTYNHLEPGDSITVNTDDAAYSIRLTGITYTQDNRLECTAKYNAPAIYVRTAIGEEGTSTGQTLTLAGATTFALLDIPLLLDSLDQPGFPVAMTGYLSGWPGGVLFRSDDSGQTWDDIQGFGKPGAVIGTARNVIGATVTAMIDKSSALAVSLINGELSSVTELAMLNGANYFAYGANGRWEIIAAQNCTLQGDGSYILTDLLRGQQGTEWACGLHAIGDRVIALDASLAFVGTSLNSIGASKTYRGVTLGKTLDSASDTSFTYAGVNLECLSPVYLNGNRNAANDWSLTWIRRTRVGGALRDYVDASLGEASESYEVEIYSSNTYATLKRTITGLTTPSAAYTSAQQVTDFGSNQSTLYVKIYQLSANVGRGYPLITSITR